jgi:nicotinate phosphoribosyltransferase
MKGLHTDLYQLTMAAGYFASGKTAERAVFELFVRRMPANRDVLIAAGLQQAVEYILDLRFTGEQIDYLKTLPQLERAKPAFWEYLRAFRFTGDLFAMREGTPFFAGEPLATVYAPLIEAQLPETYLLATLGFQSLIASKAVRVARAAQGKAVVEFGTRRAHSPEAGVLAARAAYIGGCTGTSNVEAGFRYGIPVFGTSAHSWVQAFPSEERAFRALQELLGERTIYLIDTYDTVQGARKVIELGKPLWGVRLDSGNLATLARSVRQILDHAGLSETRIMATSDLNEYRIAELVGENAPIDAFGVGTDLATSADAPALSAVYKLVELDISGIKRYTSKHSAEKQTLPGAKQVFRYEDSDVIGCSSECAPNGMRGQFPEALLRPVILGGQVVEPLPSASEAREYCAAALDRIQSGWAIEYSQALTTLGKQHASHSGNSPVT